MLKKIVAILLSITVMLTLCPVMGVFAALPTNSQTGYWADNFDDETISTGNFAGYPKSGTHTSDVFEAKSGESACFSIVSKDGSETDKVLRFSSHNSAGTKYSSNTQLYVKTITLETGIVHCFSYDVRFKSFPTANGTYAQMYMMRSGGAAGLKLDGNKVYKFSGDTVGATLTTDKWYRVVGVFEGTTGSSYVTDADTGEIILSNTNGNLSSATTQTLKAGYFVPTYINEGQFVAEFDNAELMKYTAADYKPSVISSTITDGATDISTDTTTLTVEFDQPLKNGFSATVNGTACTMTKVSNKLNTYTVSLPALASGTIYTVDFSGCKNIGDAASTDTITFTTAGTPGGSEEPDEPELPVDEILTYTENFNELEVGTVSKSFGSNTTGILEASTQQKIEGAYEIVNGYEGAGLKFSTMNRDIITANHALRSNKTVAAAEVYTAEGVTQYENLVATYRFNIGQMPSFNYPDKTSVTINKEYNDVTFRGVDMRIGVGTQDDKYYGMGVSKSKCAKIYTAPSNGITYVHYGDDTNTDNGYGVINENTWYDVIMGVNGTQVSISIKETVTGKKVWSHSFNPGTFDAEDELTFILGGQSLNFSDSAQTQLWNHNMEVTFDDFTLYRIKPWVESHKLTADYDAASKIISFNQPVASADGIQLYKKIGEENVADTFAVGTFTSSDFCKMKVEYENVFPGIDYACDYSKVKSITGVGFAENNSATKLFNFTVDSAPVSFASAPTYALTGGNLTFDFYSDVAQDAKFIAAFYNGNELVKPVLIDKELVNGITSDISIPLGEGTITANRLRIFALDGEGKLVPLANSYDEAITE